MKDEGPNLILAFANNFDLTGNCRSKTKAIFIRCEKEMENMRLVINENKTKPNIRTEAPIKETQIELNRV